ncbi:hypothetical protein C6A86_024135 [Mycobacterium sp. ITM-2016-00316]|uniref:hypothetical protein n=1 Tax=Mycobacterium sp. ITM-2016-00316 TaxID=2099695 RepID=UPI000CFA5A54|nr:hypothetical protein [Mycobacterium sp. ITM-2016-00316]WNG81241.1 hypothetical protein C6A86_024135 [Mycobacterium sp. ITM-2016-00316]
MTAIKRRFAAASLATLMPLAAISIATAAPSVAETTCGAGQSEFNGSCVDNCNKSQVRNSDTGKCQSLLSAALQKAETPAVAKLTPEQMGGAWQLAQQAQMIPEGTRVWNSVVGTVDTVIGWPVLATSAAADVASTLAFLNLIPDSGFGVARTASATGATFSAANDIAQVARSLPSPQVGLPKIGMPPHPKLGFPPHPKIGMPRIGMPKLGASGICGPKLLFFTPCL